MIGEVSILEVHCGTKHSALQHLFGKKTQKKHLAQIYFMTRDALSFHILNAFKVRSVIPDDGAQLRSCSTTNKNPQVHIFLGQQDRFQFTMTKTRKHLEAPGNTSAESNCIKRLIPACGPLFLN